MHSKLLVKVDEGSIDIDIAIAIAIAIVLTLFTYILSTQLILLVSRIHHLLTQY